MEAFREGDEWERRGGGLRTAFGSANRVGFADRSVWMIRRGRWMSRRQCAGSARREQSSDHDVAGACVDQFECCAEGV
jgi:hypothetical protein